MVKEAEGVRRLLLQMATNQLRPIKAACAAVVKSLSSTFYFFPPPPFSLHFSTYPAIVGVHAETVRGRRQAL